MADAADGGVIKALAGVKVSVVPRGAVDVINSLVDIYQADAPNLTQGPDPKTGASGTNPFITNASGSVRFWADGPAEYDIVFEDTDVPMRVNDRVGWNSSPAKVGSIPTATLKVDAGIPLGMLATPVIQTLVPIGAVIDWYRPSTAVQVPLGFKICDGTAVPSGQHDFVGHPGGFNLPDLRNVFILGADVNKADAVTYTGGVAFYDSKNNAPGIRGESGSNKHVLSKAQLPNHSHNYNDKYATNSGTLKSAAGTQSSVDGLAADNYETGTIGNDEAHNNMPLYYGLLKIMKVKRA